jgi:hypothetical protein
MSLAGTCTDDQHVWSNDYGDDWTPDVGTRCDCGQRLWSGGLVGLKKCDQQHEIWIPCFDANCWQRKPKVQP